MVKSLALLVAAAVVSTLAACTRDTDTPPGRTGGGAAARCDPRLDAAFTAWADAGFSGSVAISTSGRFDCLAAYGSANDTTGTANTVDTVFSIGSVTKSVTAATVFDLVDAGKLALGDRVGRLLPELTGPVAGVTVEQLLLHTSGLSGTHAQDHEPLDRAAALAAISDLELAFTPGSGYAYSNAGYTLLALLVERVSGMSYREYTASRMLRLPGGRVAGGFWDGAPAAPGPRAVGYLEDGRAGEPGDFPGPHWAVDGNGSLAMTMRDLATWTHALFTGRVVSPESVAAIRKPARALGEGRSETPGWAAFDAAEFGQPFLAAAGGGGDVGHNTVVAWVPSGQRVIAMASNKPGLSAEALLRAVGPALLGREPVPTPSARPTGTSQAVTAGRYELAMGGAFDVTAAGNQVTVAGVGADAVAALFPPGGGVSAEDFRAHERRVLALLAGATREGREERKALEDTLGPIRDVRPAGTMVRDGEIRTYVTLVTGSGPALGWYAVSEDGGIAAVEAPTDPPVLKLVPAGGGRYRPDDPAGAGPQVTIEVRDRRLTVTGPAGTTVATLTG